MNWLDLLFAVLLGVAAFRGFTRGFIIEACSLLALLLGIWAGVHFSGRVGEAMGMDPERAAIPFLVTFVIVLVGVHFLSRALTKVIDLAQLGFANKLAGIGFGMVRSAFIISIALNLLAGWSGNGVPSASARQDSALHEPLRAFAPFVIPVLGETKWVMDATDRAKREARELFEGR